MFFTLFFLCSRIFLSKNPAARGRLSSEAKSILLGLVAEAESYFGAGLGKIKLSAVLGRLYATMPTLFAVLFRQKTITDWVEEAVAALRADMPPTDITPAQKEPAATPDSRSEKAPPAGGDA